MADETVKLQRWSPGHDPYPDAPDPDGEYVLYEDASAAIEQQAAKVEALEREVVRMKVLISLSIPYVRDSATDRRAAGYPGAAAQLDALADRLDTAMQETPHAE